MVIIIFGHSHGAGQAYGPTHSMSLGNTRALGIRVWSFFFFDTYMVQTSIVIIKIARRETRKIHVSGYVYVVVQFYLWFKLYSPLFWGMGMCEMSLKQTKMTFEPRMKLNHNVYHNKTFRMGFCHFSSQVFGP